MDSLIPIWMRLASKELDREKAESSKREIRALFQAEPTVALDDPEIDSQINAWLNRMSQIDDVMRNDSGFGES